MASLVMLVAIDYFLLHLVFTFVFTPKYNLSGMYDMKKLQEKQLEEDGFHRIRAKCPGNWKQTKWQHKRSLRCIIQNTYCHERYAQGYR